MPRPCPRSKCRTGTISSSSSRTSSDRAADISHPEGTSMQKLVAALSLVCALIAPAGAQEDVATFYKDKQIRLIVGSAVGSGYDIGARAVARYLRQHIPGNPNIIVQNQPGAASLSM